MERIWGARSLAPLYPEKKDLPKPVGEVWLTGNDCVLASGPFSGKKLGEAWRAMPLEWTGTRLSKDGPFPLLVKFLFPEEWLSVQVHPDDDYARAHEAAAGGTGKTEMWYAMAARAGAEVLVGLKAGVTPESFREAIQKSAVEECVRRMSVREGDAIFVSAGTVHTIGPGLILCEIQENSDITYRVYDYQRVDASGKPRVLHIEQAVAAANYGGQRSGKVQPVRVEKSPRARDTFFAACRYFATEKWEFSEPVAAHPSPERFELLIFLAGFGKIEAAGQSAEYAAAQAWMVPAATGNLRLSPDVDTTLLRTYVPDLQQIESHFRRAGVPEAQWSQVMFR